MTPVGVGVAEAASSRTSRMIRATSHYIAVTFFTRAWWKGTSTIAL